MAAIAAVRRVQRLPDTVLEAIARVESGRIDPASGNVMPWPWAINVGGVGHLYESKADAIAAVLQFQAAGQRSIDVGCMQINLAQHPGAFVSLDEAFDPVANVSYGGNFLQFLFRQRGDWSSAVAAYHSSTPAIGADYLRRIALQAPSNSKFLALVQPALALGRLIDPGVGHAAFVERVTPIDHLAPLDQTPGLARYREQIADDRRRNLITAGILTPQGGTGVRVFAQRSNNPRSRLN